MLAYYYLHVNGSLIYKHLDVVDTFDFIESPFVRTYWLLNTERRETAWEMLIEAKSLGANEERILELKNTWKCNDEDALKYLERLPQIKYENEETKSVSFKDVTGKGTDFLEALSDLCTKLGFRCQKPIIITFHHLLTP